MLLWIDVMSLSWQLCGVLVVIVISKLVAFLLIYIDLEAVDGQKF